MSKREIVTGFRLYRFTLVMCYSIHGLSDHLRQCAGYLHVDFGPITRQQHFIDALDGVYPDPIRVLPVGTRKEISNACTFLFHRLATRHWHDRFGLLYREHCSDCDYDRGNHESPSNYQGKPGTKRDRYYGSVQPSAQKIISTHRLFSRSGTGCDGDDHNGWYPLHVCSLNRKGGSASAAPLAGCPFS